MKHLVAYFIAAVPKTKCGRWVDSENVVAYPEEAECKQCLKAT